MPSGPVGCIQGARSHDALQSVPPAAKAGFHHMDFRRDSGRHHYSFEALACHTVKTRWTSLADWRLAVSQVRQRMAAACGTRNCQVFAAKGPAFARGQRWSRFFGERSLLCGGIRSCFASETFLLAVVGCIMWWSQPLPSCCCGVIRQYSITIRMY